MQRQLETSLQHYVRAPSYREETFRNYCKQLTARIGPTFRPESIKFVEVRCIPYNIRFQTFVTPQMTWKMLKNRIYVLMTRTFADYTSDMPLDIQDIGIGSHHITIRGKKGSQDIHSKISPFDSLPQGGILFVNQVFRQNTWIALNQGWP